MAGAVRNLHRNGFLRYTPPLFFSKQCRRPSEWVGDPVGGPLSPCSAGRGVNSLALPGSSADQPGRLSDEPGHQRLNAVTTRRRVREQQQGDAGPIAYCLFLHHFGMVWAALFLVILLYLHPRPSGTLWEGTKSHRVLRRGNSAKVTQSLLPRSGYPL